MDGDLLPAFLIAKEVGVSRQLVYWWVKTGRLEKAGEHNGRALYSLTAAARLDKAMRHSPLSRRSQPVA